MEASRLLPHRSLFEIHQRARHLKQRQHPVEAGPRRRWTAEEDAQLQRLAREQGYRHWDAVSAGLSGGGRTAKQCSNRWLYLVGKDPALAQGWSAREDDALAALVASQGTHKWPQLAARLGKTPNACKLRWERVVHPMRNASTPWTEAEDRLVLAQQARGRTWLAIAHTLPGRTLDAVKARHAELTRSPSPPLDDKKKAGPAAAAGSL